MLIECPIYNVIDVTAAVYRRMDSDQSTCWLEEYKDRTCDLPEVIGKVRDICNNKRMCTLHMNASYPCYGTYLRVTTVCHGK